MHPTQHPARRRRSALFLAPLTCSLALLGGCAVDADEGKPSDTSTTQLSPLTCEVAPEKMAEELFNRVCEPGNEDSLFAATVWLTIDGTVFLDLPGDDPVALADTAAAEFRRVHEDFVDLLTAEYPEVQIPPGQGGDPFVTIIAPGMDLLQITRVPGVDTVSISIDESAAGYQ